MNSWRVPTLNMFYKWHNANGFFVRTERIIRAIQIQIFHLYKRRIFDIDF